MRLIVYGKGNQNIQQMLPFLARKEYTALPGNLQQIAIDEAILKLDDGKLVPGSRFVLYSEEFSSLRKDAQEYIRILRESLPDLQQALASSSLQQSGFTWEMLQHMLIFAFGIDMGILRYLYKKAVLEENADQFYIWGFEDSIIGKNPFGVRVLPNQAANGGLAYLWHPELKDGPKVQTPDIEYLGQLSAGLVQTRDQKKDLLMRFYGILGQNASGPDQLIIPVIDYAADADLLARINQVAYRIFEEVTMPMLTRYDHLPTYKHGVARIAMEYAADYAVQTGVVPPFSTVQKTAQRCWLFKNIEQDSFLKRFMGAEL